MQRSDLLSVLFLLIYPTSINYVLKLSQVYSELSLML
jgi:hypothetical protein